MRSEIIVISDLDIYRSAKAMIERHGDESALIAAMRADKLGAAGDLDGMRVWVRIMKAIDELQGRGIGSQTRH